MLAGFSAAARIAGYRLEDRACAGGMAVVFRAVDERLDRQVALKVLSPELAADEEFRQRFIWESRAAAAVDDPHLIPVYEAGEADGVLFIAMRYVAGGDVRSLVQRDGPLSPARMAAIISPVASALDAAHASGVVYLADFGISGQVLSAARLTGTGQFLGTSDYCAPEQIQGMAVDGRADQYALACTAFELLSGQPPFRRHEAAAVIWAQMTERPPSLTSRRADLPHAADAVLAKALAKRPEARYPTCREFAGALRAALGLAPYDSGTPLIRQADRRRPEASHDARDAGTGPLAAAQNGHTETAKDATAPIRITTDDHGRHRGRPSRHRRPSRRPAPMTWMARIGVLAVAGLARTGESGHQAKPGQVLRS
jgi:serine/threonine-protein kinase